MLERTDGLLNYPEGALLDAAVVNERGSFLFPDGPESRR